MMLACTLWDESDLNISTDGELLLDIIDETPYLCLLLSSDLSWANYILNICSTLWQKMSVLCHMKTKIPKTLLNIIYITGIQPHIDCWITVWGSAPDIHLDKVQRLQNVLCRTSCHWKLWLVHTRHWFLSTFDCCLPWVITPDVFWIFEKHFPKFSGFFFAFVNMGLYGSKNVKRLLLPQITFESFQTFPKFSSQ